MIVIVTVWSEVAVMMAQNRGGSWPVSTKAWPWQNPAEGPRTALARMRSTLGCGTGSLVNRRTMCLRRTTSAKSTS